MRSITMAHINTHAMKIQLTTGPPRARIPLYVVNGAARTSSMTFRLQTLCKETCALLIENLHDRLRQRSQPGLREHQRDCDNQADDRCDHRLRDTCGHELRIR